MGQDEAKTGPQLANTFGVECICQPLLRKQSRWGQDEAKMGQDEAKMRPRWAKMRPRQASFEAMLAPKIMDLAAD